MMVIHIWSFDMQFVTRGPDVPDSLLRAHEEGRVVFFCGAGISTLAGLPLFTKLVDEVYQKANTDPTPIENASDPDLTLKLHLLEARLVGTRTTLRTLVSKILTPTDLSKKGVLNTHLSLLQLGRTRDGTLRLVTTNYDRLFHYAMEKNKRQDNVYSAPALPNPKASRWDGLVFLHGLLPQNENDQVSLNQLVLTSGDFGLAYLVERWAARFVTELFRSYEVCFIGYSVNDPILRYVMDAFSADRRLGESTQKVWAFAPYKKNKYSSEKKKWESKGINAILYRSTKKHTYLHKTIQRWAESYQSGITAKEYVIRRFSSFYPSKSTQEDNFVGKMIWALSDSSGKTAQLFSQIEPLPKLEWLFDAFSVKRYCQPDLPLFEIKQDENIEDNLRFSLILHPTPVKLAPWMHIVSSRATEARWDNVMQYLGLWLVRHIHDPRLLSWVIKNGGQPCHLWLDQIQDRLNYLTQLRNSNSKTVTDFPDNELFALWRLLIDGRIKCHNGSNTKFYTWVNSFKQTGLTIDLKLSLKNLLMPKIELSESYFLKDKDDPSKKSDINLVLGDGCSEYFIKSLGKEAKWQNALSQLLYIFQDLLRDALDLLSIFNKANAISDSSIWVLPSIEPHQQNKRHSDLGCLIELVRDAWLQLLKVNQNLAKQIASSWIDFPYLTFKRLALFAASKDDVILPNEWCDWLLNNNAELLWSRCMKREVMRLLSLQTSKLSSNKKKRLEKAILKGPEKDRDSQNQQSMSQKDLDYSIWLRLMKIKSSCQTLSTNATERLDDLSQKYPIWKLSVHNKEEFLYWSSGVYSPSSTYPRINDLTMLPYEDLKKWLIDHQTKNSFFEDEAWDDVCRTKTEDIMDILCDLGDKSNPCWPIYYWRRALLIWSEEKLITKSYNRLSSFFAEKIPKEQLQELKTEVVGWVYSASKLNITDQHFLVSISNRILDLTFDQQDKHSLDNDLIEEAINHPVGLLIHALVNSCFNSNVYDGECLPPTIAPIFTQICTENDRAFLNGRIILAIQLNSLFHLDPNWCKSYLLPLFNWTSHPETAKYVWVGFLASPRLSTPLFLELKKDLIKTAVHYSKLGIYDREYIKCVTSLALEYPNHFKPIELIRLFKKIPCEGKEESIQTIVQLMQVSGEHKEMFWENQAAPFLSKVWAGTKDFSSPTIIELFCDLCISAEDSFCKVFHLINKWLEPLKNIDNILHDLKESNLCSKFPEESLMFLEKIISEDYRQSNSLGLGLCLNQIKSANKSLERSPRYKKLAALASD